MTNGENPGHLFSVHADTEYFLRMITRGALSCIGTIPSILGCSSSWKYLIDSRNENAQLTCFDWVQFDV